MRLYYFADTANFGDCLNAWLWPRLLPGRWDPGDDISFSGIGTIINARMPPARRWIVFSSGVGYGGPPAGFGGAGWTVASVRGPLSAAVLGLAPSAAVTDGAILLATLPEFAAVPEDRRDGVVFVPHHEAEAADDWPEVCRRAGVAYLSPIEESREVVRRIGRARLVLAEAMHAAIVADTLRVPWLPVTTSPQVSTFKWLDWTGSMALPYTPRPVPVSATRAGLRNAMLWAYGQVHRFGGQDQQQAVRWYARHYAGEASHHRTRLNALGRRLHRRLDRALCSKRLSAWRSARDERATDRSASALARLGRSAGMLSDDRVFAARLEILATRLAGIP